MSAVVASVISTGGAGNDFERRVGAYFLALLLTRSFAPIFPDSAPTRIHFQAGRLGWRIDDLVIEVSSEAGQQRNLAAQVKRTFTLSSSDEECQDTITAAWRDFNNAALFQQGRDALVLVTYLGTNRIQHDFRWLLTQARSAGTAADFASRRNGSGTLNKRAKDDYNAVKQIVDAAEESAVSDERVWRFLQAFHVLSFDFQDGSGKDEAAIRTILGSLRAHGASIEAAATTWSELIDFAGLSAAEGRSVDLAGLPAAAQGRHKQVPSSKHGELVRLRQHSGVTLRRINEMGPRGLSFQRDGLRKKLEEAFAKHQVVFLVGAAGSGKSVLGKNLLVNGGTSDTTFAFSAEEFKAPHIDMVLANANINLTWGELDGLLPLHRKTFLIDGLERLLEASDRAAFKDLLVAATEDKTLSLVITCRDYYAEVVERSLLATSGLDFTRVVVDGLSDEELQEAAAATPALAPLLSTPALQPLLRNPFLLTQAAELQLAQGEAVPNTERALRRRMWGDLVKDEDYVADGMPAKRERVFFAVCVERARALQPYIAVADEGGALQRLANDNLVVFDETGSRVAAAHDVLEDWGLIEWFMRRFAANGGSALAMVAEVGEHPALRRAYRKWLSEQLDVDSGSVADFVAEASSGIGVPPHFRDDTWLAVFQSQSADAFMGQLSGPLLASQALLLRRVLHLVRVGCKTVSPMSQALDVTVRWHVPSGNAWHILLRFTAQNWTQLPRSMDALLVEFMEDWASAVSAVEPYPVGHDSAGSLIGAMLAHQPTGPGSAVPRERLVQLLLKVPRANPIVFVDLARRAAIPGRQSLRNDGDAEALAKHTFKPFQAIAFARDFPDELMELCRGRWLIPGSDIEGDTWRGTREIDTMFGLNHSFEHRFFPSSALQGPFFGLLRHHLERGVRFIVELVDECCSRYASSSLAGDLIGPPAQVQFTLMDGTVRTVLLTPHLWQAYRGYSSFPSVPQCALMALESRLLEVCDSSAPDNVAQSYLNFILRNSNNAASLSVVASVCIAYPERVGACAIDILGCPEFIQVDTARMIADQTPFAVGGLDAYAQVFQKERIASNALKHRKKSLEDLARQMQFGPNAADVRELLDRYVAALPPERQRSTHQSQWLLALHRMDLRTYVQTQVEGGIELSMGPLPSDVQSMISQSAVGNEQFIRKVSLQNWARRRLESGQSDASADWRQTLDLAVSVEQEITSSGVRDIMDGGPRMVAAAVARDQWEELTLDQKAWCLAVLNEALGSAPNSSDVFGGSIPVDGTSECASVLGQLTPKLDSPEAERLLVSALTHHNRHVQSAAVEGLAVDVFMNVPDRLNFVLRVLCENASVRHAQHARMEELDWDQRPDRADLLRERKTRLADADKAAWKASPPQLDAALLGDDDELVASLLVLFRSRPMHPLGQALFEWVANQFGIWWDHRDRGRSNFELQFAAREAFAEFVLACDATRGRELLDFVLPQVDEEPKEFSGLLEQMLVAADRRGNADTFWPLWAAVVERVKVARWIEAVPSGRSRGDDLVRHVFLNTQWNPGLREWRLLGSAHVQIDSVFLTLPAAGTVLEAYLRFLTDIGARSLPSAIAHIDSKFGTALESVLRESSNARFLLDQIVSRLMFEQLPALQRPALRDPMLRLLEALIQGGSSNAFLLREDFLTPSGAAAQ